MRDAVMVLGSILMGVGGREAFVWALRDWKDWRRRRGQWFTLRKPSEAPERPLPPRPAPQPGRAAVSGQRPVGRHAAPVQKRARWGTRQRATKAG